MRDDSFAFPSVIVKVVHMPLVCLFNRHAVRTVLLYLHICKTMPLFVKNRLLFSWSLLSVFFLSVFFFTTRISFVSFWASVYLLSENISHHRVQWKDTEAISLKCTSCADLRFVLGKQRISSVYVSCFWLPPCVFFSSFLILLHPKYFSHTPSLGGY